MESIKIEKDGSMSIPAPGNMKITVEMTEGLFEEFMQFRKSKDEYDNRASREIEGLRRRMNNLASAVIKSTEGATPKEKKEAKEDALELANDWFHYIGGQRAPKRGEKGIAEGQGGKEQTDGLNS